MDEEGDWGAEESRLLLSRSTHSDCHLHDPNPDDELQFQEIKRPMAKSLHRCKTAPAKDMAAVVRELQAKYTATGGGGDVGGILLIVYLVMGVLVYQLNKDQFSSGEGGVETHPIVDALYFCIVTMCTIGYGDITPLTPFTKLFSCLFVLVGFGFIDILLSGVLNYVLDLQEQNILSDILHHQTNNVNNPNLSHNRNPPFLRFLTLRLVDVQKGRMRIRLKVGLALLVLILCIGVGTLFLYFVEQLSLVDSLYLSALSVTTVGYGDKAFITLSGRLFASVWLLFSTLAVARSFLFLVEARIHKRQRTIAKWVLQRDITPLDLFAANINNNDFINKSEYVIFKLKEMGKIVEQDISQICHQFEKLDSNNMGRITLPDLLQSRPFS
uniref:Potassium channel domain-containing protein n=1 Tax=Chenopodium quinoa TaxID=63459 RepID=A0A803M787_CHEQI